MEKKNEIFNYEEYQKKHEGYIQRLVRMLKRWLRKYLKTTIAIAVLSLIITTIGVYKSCTTSDAGKIIERIYNESKNNIEETKRAIQLVELPDSLENTEEVQRYRAFQNKTLSFVMLFNSISKKPYLYYTQEEEKDKKKKEQKKKDYLGNIRILSMSSLEILSELSKEIQGELIELTRVMGQSDDTLSIAFMNPFIMTEAYYFGDAFIVLLKNTKKKLIKLNQEGNIDKLINVYMSLLSSKELINSYHSIHQNNMMMNSAINNHLIYIKNKAIEHKYGKIEITSHSSNNNFEFIPSYLKEINKEKNIIIKSSEN